MQAQDSTTLFFYQLWSWIEIKRNKLIGGVIAIGAVALVAWFMVSQRAANEIAAGQALTKIILSPSGQMSDAYMSVASQYAGTTAGKRAQVLGAAALFEAGKFPEAQAAFQKYLDAHPDGDYIAQASLGVAKCLEAQGKTDLAAAAYQRLINNSPDVAAVSNARFSLGQIDESLGRFSDAANVYQDLVNNAQGTMLASEAALRLVNLKGKIETTKTTTAVPPAASKPPVKTGP